MPDMEIISGNLHAAKPYFATISPNIPYMFTAPYQRLVKGVMFAHRAMKTGHRLWSGTPVATVTGEFISSRVIAKVTHPMKKKVAQVHVDMTRTDHDWKRKNGIGGRTWITKPGQYKMVIVFHDANRAGPHIDVHIDRLSLVYKVKPDLYAKLKYNKDGYLTENSQKAIIEHLRWEINNGSRVAQNIDHSKSNARA